VTNKGCDSIRELHLIQIDKVETQVSASICDDLPYKYSRPGEYVDTLISYRGCDSILTFEVIGVSHYLPNVFSPNDDGINDLFYTAFFPDEEIQLEYFAIFDRFGNMTYSTSKWPIIWNGKDQKNESFQPAVFAYVFIYTCGANRIIEHGDITLIK
jgi:gliding motility-associated-like protein